MESFTKQGTDHVERIEEKLMEWGSADPIAVFHQTGTGKGFGHSRVETGKGTGRGMAMRKIVALGEEDYQQIQSVFCGASGDGDPPCRLCDRAASLRKRARDAWRGAAAR